MAEAKTAVVSVVVFCLLSVLLQPGIRTQSTISSFSEDGLYSTVDEGYEFHSVDNMRMALERERQRKKTIENVSYTQSEEIQRLTMDLENELRRLKAQESQSVTATLIHTLQTRKFHGGMTRVEDKIYLIQNHPEKIIVLDERNNFSIILEIPLNGTTYCSDIVYSNISKYVYINDPTCDCLWGMTTTGEHRLTKWLTDAPWITGLSLSNEGHLLVLKYKPSSLLEIYSLNATLSRRLQLSQDVKDPTDVVQTPTGNFIILHRLNNEHNGQWVISQMTNDGQLINRFIPRNECEKFTGPSHMSLDPDNNRLFVADHFDDRVTLFDSIFLTLSQVLVSKEMNGIHSCYRLVYDAHKKYLFVAQYFDSVAVFEIN